MNHHETVALVRKHDPLGLYDSLEPWQQQEMLCMVRRISAEMVVLHKNSQPR
jgi:hypothetical protein